VTVVFPSIVVDAMLPDREPWPERVVIVLPAPVVDPDTDPPPAVTELVSPPEGGRSPSFKCTVLQF
jgi:hypothetical protein